MAFGNTQGDGSGTAKWLKVDSNGSLILAGRATLQADETANDSDKTIAVSASVEWEIMTIWVELITTATVGNRQIVIEFQDNSSDVIGQIRAGAVQAASLTRNYMFGQALGVDLTSFRDTSFLMTPLPKIILPAAYIVRVYDNAAVDAAADDLVIQMMVMERSIP